MTAGEWAKTVLGAGIAGALIGTAFLVILIWSGALQWIAELAR